MTDKGACGVCVCESHRADVLCVLWQLCCWLLSHDSIGDPQQGEPIKRATYYQLVKSAEACSSRA